MNVHVGAWNQTGAAKLTLGPPLPLTGLVFITSSKMVRERGGEWKQEGDRQEGGRVGEL